ncbi:hypothetical protein [Haladaptatus halobius]|jgi:Zn finger protein HypA/HybF involved in hydrogenase expression|uniref:hypothetical protein n=1 Tax=Haladaptatus halobius TaxID=2884875 RepID=UPI001D0B6563|nr:hypothetical protein [Haladaptatus halobius]
MATKDEDERERVVEGEQAPEDEQALGECERCGESVLSVYIENGVCPQCRGE